MVKTYNSTIPNWYLILALINIVLIFIVGTNWIQLFIFNQVNHGAFQSSIEHIIHFLFFYFLLYTQTSSQDFMDRIRDLWTRWVG